MGRAAPHQRGGRAPHARQHNKCAFRRSAHPSLGMGANRQRPTRAQKRAAGTRKTVLFDIVSSRSAPLRGSHPNVSNRRRLPRRPGRARAECRAEPRVLPAPAAIHQRARALYFSCYLQVRPAGLHPSRAPPAQLYTRCRRTACRLRARVGVEACGHRSLRSRSARRKPVSCPGRA
jgi:hypothetical protein